MTVTAIAPAQAGVEVGSFFARSWGYDQTQVDFYKVIGLTPKGVRLQKWQSKTVRDDGFSSVRVVAGDRPKVTNEWPRATREDIVACGHCSGHGYAIPTCPEHGPRPTEARMETKRLSSYDGKTAYVAVGNYDDHAYLWDGHPMYETAHGAGH